ncbi:DUF1538 family protein [Geoalkalibacter halelectricus]|uniref:DUF1538 family protein n=1 Tax=Geoalkalibacter halelectricus TaxID=2847045 RepID=UPI003D22B4B8
MRELASICRGILSHAVDVAPLVAVIVFFQAAVLRRPLPDTFDVLAGLLVLIIGLGLFMRGLEIALFPAGESIGHALARRGSRTWLFAFAFFVGTGTVMAEPALVAVAERVATAVVAAGLLADTPQARGWYALGFRLSIALGVGSALVLGVLRIAMGWPLHRLLGPCAAVVCLALILAPKEYSAVALDAGAVALSTISVPLVTALGIGLATSIRGRNALVEGFGLVALAALVPAALVLSYGALTRGLS